MDVTRHFQFCKRLNTEIPSALPIDQVKADVPIQNDISTPPTVNFQLLHPNKLQPNVPSTPMQPVHMLSPTTWWHPQSQVMPPQQPIEGHSIDDIQNVPTYTAGWHQQQQVYQPPKPILRYPVNVSPFISSFTAGWHKQPQLLLPQQPFQGYPVNSTQYVPDPTANQQHISPQQSTTPFIPPLRHELGTSVYVRGMAASITDSQLYDEFQRFGQIEHVTVIVVLFILKRKYQIALSAKENNDRYYQKRLF